MLAPGNGANALAFRPDGTALAVAGGARAVELWDPATGRKLATATGHDGREVAAVAFAPDGTRLVTGGGDKRALVWDVRR